MCRQGNAPAARRQPFPATPNPPAGRHEAHEARSSAFRRSAPSTTPPLSLRPPPSATPTIGRPSGSGGILQPRRPPTPPPPIPNTKGVAPSSPGLARGTSAYPGSESINSPTLKVVLANLSQSQNKRCQHPKTGRLANRRPGTSPKAWGARLRIRGPPKAPPRIPNTKGVAPSSPGLARGTSAYPGSRSINFPTLKVVVANLSQSQN